MKNKVWFNSFGPIGAGKTTLFRKLNLLCNGSSLIETNNILIEDSRLNFYLTQTIELKRDEYFFPFQMEILPMRFWKAYNAPNYSFVDETIYCTKAYSLALLKMGKLTDFQYDTFNSNYNSYLKLLPPPKTIFYFHCSTTLLLKHIEKRAIEKGREIEKLYSYDYVDCLNTSFKETFSELRSHGFSVREIETGGKDLNDLALEVFKQESFASTFKHG